MGKLVLGLGDGLTVHMFYALTGLLSLFVMRVLIYRNHAHYLRVLLCSRCYAKCFTCLFTRTLGIIVCVIQMKKLRLREVKVYRDDTAIILGV